MGENQNQPFQLSFNTSLKIDSQGSRVSSDGGLIVVRELDERLILGELIAQHLTTPAGAKTRSFRWPTCCVSNWAKRWCFVPTRPSPSRRSTRRWRSGA